MNTTKQEAAREWINTQKNCRREMERGRFLITPYELSSLRYTRYTSSFQGLVSHKHLYLIHLHWVSVTWYWKSPNEYRILLVRKIVIRSKMTVLFYSLKGWIYFKKSWKPSWIYSAFIYLIPSKLCHTGPGSLSSHFCYTRDSKSHSFIQQMFIEPLLWARCHFRCYKLKVQDRQKSLSSRSF